MPQYHVYPSMQGRGQKQTGCHVPKMTSGISRSQNASLSTYFQGSPRHDNNSGNPKPQPTWMKFLGQTLNPFLIFSLPSQSTQKNVWVSLWYKYRAISKLPKMAFHMVTWVRQRDGREIIHASNSKLKTFYPSIWALLKVPQRELHSGAWVVPYWQGLEEKWSNAWGQKTSLQN